MSAPTLTPAAVALLNAVAAVPVSSDPWAKYPAVLSIHHVAELIGTTPAAASEAARRGNIPMRKRLGRYMIDQVAFRAWVAGKSEPAPEPAPVGGDL